MAQIPLFMATGWLGSGKTTFLKNLLERHAGERKIAVVQNEFAPSGVDGLELKRTGKPFRMLELNRGSVFCVCLFSDFCRSLSALVDEYRPEAVVLEATGLADPIAVAQLLEAPDLKQRLFLGHIWCLADVSAYAKYSRAAGQIAHQIRVADTILLNKCDRAGAEEIERVKTEIAALNPFARIEPTSYAGTNLDGLFETALAAPVAGRITGEEPAARPQVETVVLRQARLAVRGELEEFLRKYAPGVWRMKGFVPCREGCFSVQLSYGSMDILEVAHCAGPAEVTALGGGFDPGRMRADFARLFRGSARA